MFPQTSPTKRARILLIAHSGLIIADTEKKKDISWIVVGIFGLFRYIYQIVFISCVPNLDCSTRIVATIFGWIPYIYLIFSHMTAKVERDLSSLSCILCVYSKGTPDPIDWNPAFRLAEKHSRKCGINITNYLILSTDLESASKFTIEWYSFSNRSLKINPLTNFWQSTKPWGIFLKMAFTLGKKVTQPIRIQDSSHMTTKNRKMSAILSYNAMLISISCFIFCVPCGENVFLLFLLWILFN